ncbi:ComEA family DNA-binding protein [Streptomyces galbus]|uniref:ComEA family DNA-binding protein n=1 Tax=Streptomyces galbus TaxID=33898 RepID=A0ABX1IP02_STRGB|nr:ComEA family DNA-binding protein [Streptomyces galbus]NKQ27364.1 ComEA family DNA-binding protein [Streptomyces galbus]
MALRSRTVSTTSTSGPGRQPGSDGRPHPRRTPVRDRTAKPRPGHASADELRRRARVLFAERDGDGRQPPDGRAESGVGADSDPGRDTGTATGTGMGTGMGTGTGTGMGPLTDPEGAVSRRQRLGSAVRERMPLWMQTGYGLERRRVMALAVVLAAAVVFAVQQFWSGRTQTVSAPEVVKAVAPYDKAPAGPTASVTGVTGGPPPSPQPSSSPDIVVDVSGKVRKPGIHRLPAGSRVADALRAAGGVRPGTDTDSLNRARFLVDGEQVAVGIPGAAPGASSGAGAGGVAGSVAGGLGGAGAGAAPGAPISLSTATVEQLDTLPGVGPVLAQHIVDYRTRHGGFRSVDELREVNGIGERRFADLRNLVRP